MMDEMDIVEVEETGPDTKEFISEENQCNICRETLQNKDELFNHVEKQHDEYSKRILGVVSRNW